jgi:phage gp37-like protein
MAHVTIIDEGILHTALVETIRTYPPIKQYAKTIEAYQGQLEEDIGVISAQLPACYVMFSDTVGGAILNREQEIDVTFSILVASASLLDRNTARQGRSVGTSYTPGVYTILRDLRDLLIGNALGIEHIPPLWLVRQHSILITKTMTICQADYVSKGNIIPRTDAYITASQRQPHFE